MYYIYTKINDDVYYVDSSNVNIALNESGEQVNFYDVVAGPNIIDTVALDPSKDKGRASTLYAFKRIGSVSDYEEDLFPELIYITDLTEAYNYAIQDANGNVLYRLSSQQQIFVNFSIPDNYAHQGTSHYKYERSEEDDITRPNYISNISISNKTYVVKDAEAREQLSNTQPKLIAGSNIEIDEETNTISAIAGGGSKITIKDWRNA